jgi:hypothetical protein
VRWSNRGHKNGGGAGLALTLEDAAIVARKDRIAEEGPVQHVADAEALRRECRGEGDFEQRKRPRRSVAIRLAMTRQGTVPRLPRKSCPWLIVQPKAADNGDATR